MTDEPFFGVSTVGLSKRQGRKPSSLLQAINHNLRATQKERGARAHIDPARMYLNEVLAGPDTPEAVVELARSLMLVAGVDTTKLRKDYTQAIELLFSLSANHRLDGRAYFTACAAWAAAQFGAANILSAVVHNDEAQPHLHVLISPLVDGRVRGSALLARPKLAALRESFFRVVARAFGLQKPPSRLSGAIRGQLARTVLARLESAHDAVLKSMAWQSIRRAIERDPGPFADDLGIEIEVVAPKRKTMTAIFTGTGKGAKMERTDKTKEILKPIGFEMPHESAPEKHRNLSCVGFTPKQPPPATPKAPAPDKPFPESVRVRDHDLDSALYDPITGEYFSAPPRPGRCNRGAADAWVAAALPKGKHDEKTTHA